MRIEMKIRHEMIEIENLLRELDCVALDRLS